MKIDKKGLLGVSPLIFFLVFFVTASVIAGDFSRVSILVVFFLSTVYAVAITKGLSLPDRVRIIGRGAGTTKMMFVAWILPCAGIFATSASEMGCIDEAVNCLLSILPSQYIFASLFITGCFVSMATGSGIGSIVSLGPIAVGIANATGADMSLICSIVVCGAMFGDNLSFISDTTVIATTTQGCEMKDKFYVNIWMALPAAIVTIIIYLVLGVSTESVAVNSEINYVKVLPYILVIVMAMVGVDVLVTLLIGTLVCGVMGMAYGDFDIYGWMSAMEQGMSGMCNLIIMILIAAGFMALITHNGGLDYISRQCTKIIRGRRSAEMAITVLSAVTCICTADNAVAIFTIAPTAKNISEQYGIDPRRTASLMDTSACIIQELIPYSIHLLSAAAIGGVAAVTLIPYVYYPYALFVFMVIAIVFNLPRMKPKKTKSI